MLKWLNDIKDKVTTSEFVFYVKWEITEGGATNPSIKKYIEDLHKAGLVEYAHPFWKISPIGRKWLERHSI